MTQVIRKRARHMYQARQYAYTYIYTPLSNKFHQIFAKVNKKVTFTIGFKGNEIKDKLTAAN